MTASARSAVVSERALLALMAGVWAAVLIAPSGRWVGALLVAAAVGVRATAAPGQRRVRLVLVAVVACAGLRGTAAEAAYRLAEPATLRAEPATMVTDVEPRSFGWRAEAKLERTGQRVRLNGAGFETPGVVAGQPIVVSGRLGPVDGSDWDRSRHVVGAVAGADLRATGPLPWFRRPAEWMRAGVLGATASFDEDQAALYHGLVIGDDRFQGEGQQAQFRAAGLSHLLAVSGQNVSFLLAVFAPISRRLRPGAAMAAIAGILLVFALATRLEPSVLRATVTAGVSTLAATRSARSTGVRSLCLAVVGLLLVDPFLGRSVGFRLSVGASLGILLLSPSIRRRISGPNWITEPTAITLAAQIGVSPILLLVFGPVATVSIPANLLAGWAAGAVMTLGLSVGLVAAVVPDRLAEILQLPSQGLVWWIDRVAAEAAAAPLPVLSLAAVPWLLVATIAVWWLPPTRWRAGWWLVPLLVTVSVTSTSEPRVDGLYRGPSGWVLVLDDPGRRWVDELVVARVTAIDTVVAADGGRSTANAVARVREVAVIDVVLAPGDHRIVGARRVLDDLSVLVDGGYVEIVAQPSELRVEAVVAEPGDG